MVKKPFVAYEIGKIRLIGEQTEGLPMWSINHYLDEFCNNYNKIMIVRRICELAQHGAADAQFWVAKESAQLFPKKSTEQSYSCNEEDYIILTTHDLNPEKFWHIIFKYFRPVVFYKTASGMVPLLDSDKGEAVKITSMSYNSPVIIDVIGAIKGLVDVASASKRDALEEEAHMARQVGALAENYSRLASAYKVINDERTPEGIRHYANNGIEKLMQRQEILNKKLGIRIDHIDVHR